MDAVSSPTSALGQKQTSQGVCTMSALPPKADIPQRNRDVRYVSQADLRSAANNVVIRSRIGASDGLSLLTRTGHAATEIAAQ
jgi:hypothetical protein